MANDVKHKPAEVKRAMENTLRVRRERLADRLDQELRQRDLIVFDGRVTHAKSARRRWWWMQVRSVIASVELLLVIAALLLSAYAIYLVLDLFLGLNLANT